MSKFSWMLIIAIVATMMMLGSASCKEETEWSMEPQKTQGDDNEKIEAIYNYLISQPGGMTSDDPLKLEIDLQLTERNWLGILNAIDRARKYVNLDLSKCDYAEVEKTGGLNCLHRFDPVAGVTIGKNRIVELFLPKDALEISGIFTNFSNMKTVTGDNITKINTSSTFSGLSNLEEANFPCLTSFLTSTFRDCKKLKRISFSKAATLGKGDNFEGCLSLTFILTGEGPLNLIEDGKAIVRNNNELVAYPGAKGKVTLPLNITKILDYAFAGSAIEEAEFHAVENVSTGSFYHCNSLKKITLPAALTIDYSAFYYANFLSQIITPKLKKLGSYSLYGTPKDLFITLGPEPPEVGYNLLESSSSPKVVTIKVPSGAEAEYDETWQQAFLGKGSAGTGTVVSNLSLNFEYY